MYAIVNEALHLVDCNGQEHKVKDLNWSPAVNCLPFHGKETRKSSFGKPKTKKTSVDVPLRQSVIFSKNSTAQNDSVDVLMY